MRVPTKGSLHGRSCESLCRDSTGLCPCNSFGLLSPHSPASMAVFGLLRQPATGERLCSFYSVVWGLRRSSVREWGHESGISRVPATGRNGVARQNWGSFWHVLAVCVARFSSWQILIKPESAVKYCSLVVCVSKLCPKLQMQVRCKKLKTHLFSGLWKNKTAAFARFSVADAPNISNQCCKLRWFVPPLPLSFRSVSTLRGSYGRS